VELFDALDAQSAADAPLAARMRPRALDDFLGQEHILLPGMPLRRAIEADAIGSMVLWGPPGCGKTTLAHIIARTTRAAFEPFHAASSGVPELRKIITAAQERRRRHGRKTILFMDEIHRFNKAQQDALLPYVEDGTVTLIGATTENPSFELTPPLLSRVQVLVLRGLEAHHVRTLLEHAQTAQHGLAPLAPDVPDAVLDRITAVAGGDARTALNLLEAATVTAPREAGRAAVRMEHLDEVLARHAIPHDKHGDYHYQLISALIKSIRGSDPDAAVYWLARLLEGGEDARFIARRLVISASEDVGNADPHALAVAVGAAHAVEYVGLPEAQIALAQATTYLASAPKSNAAYAALMAAREAVRSAPLYPVPLHLRNAVTELQRALQYGDGYRYAHDAEDGFLPQEHLPPELTDAVFYHPKEVGAEAGIRARLAEWRRRREGSRKGGEEERNKHG
jgi:putative ATPase